MAQDLGFDFAAGPAVAGLVLDITAGNDDDTTSFDLGSPGPLQLGIKIVAVTGAGTPAGNQQVIARIRWSHDNSVFDDLETADILWVDTITASNTINKNVTIPAKAQYGMLNFENDQSSGPALTTGTLFELYDIFGDQA